MGHVFEKAVKALHGLRRVGYSIGPVWLLWIVDP
jgi:hypothetical protein